MFTAKLFFVLNPELKRNLKRLNNEFVKTLTPLLGAESKLIFKCA